MQKNTWRKVIDILTIDFLDILLMIKQHKIFKLFFAYMLIRGEKEETKDTSTRT